MAWSCGAAASCRVGESVQQGDSRTINALPRGALSPTYLMGGDNVSAPQTKGKEWSNWGRSTNRQWRHYCHHAPGAPRPALKTTTGIMARITSPTSTHFWL